MSDETWMNAKKAVELGFADKVLYTEGVEDTISDSLLFGRRTVFNTLLAKFPKAEPPAPPVDTGEIEQYKNQFEII
jgi:ATP-dependent Clp protease protease subunit